MGLPVTICSARLRLRRPTSADAQVIYAGWASDPLATRFMSWPRHEAIGDALGFVEFSDSEWERSPAGPYLVERLDTGEVIGSSGFGFHAVDRAEIGYIFSRAAWGQGFATETVNALVSVAGSFGVLELNAPVHPANAASIRVLEKCGFTPGERPIQTRFPNSGDAGQVNATRFRRSLG